KMMTSHKNKLLLVMQLCSIVLATTLIAVSAQAQAPSASSGRDNIGNPGGGLAFRPRFRFSLVPEGVGRTTATGGGTAGSSRAGAFGLSPMGGGPILPVVGSGILGRLTKWTGFTSTNSLIGDTSMFEDKLGNVGIGTDTPTSRFTVSGLIETTLGGYKFPDGTIQTTALSSGDVVRSLDGLKGDVTLAAGANILITPSNNILTIAAPDSLTRVAHDLTLAGAGTFTSPLRVAVPLKLTGGLPGFDSYVIEVANSSGGLFGGRGLFAKGGGGNFGGVGVVAAGGDTTGSNGKSGAGLLAFPGVADFGSGNINGLAAEFDGDVLIFGGNLDVTGSKNFKIDHPLDPENKYLVHAAIESSEVLNLYTGNVIIGQDGEAVVTLPNWFGVLNRDFRYQLTAIGAPGQGLYIAEEVNKNQFRIAGGTPGMKVSWQVTGVRSDARSLQHPFKAEQDKPERERGTYLAPEAFGQPEEKGFMWSRYPDLMEQRKRMRNQMKQQ